MAIISGVIRQSRTKVTGHFFFYEKVILGANRRSSASPLLGDAAERRGGAMKDNKTENSTREWSRSEAVVLDVCDGSCRFLPQFQL